MMGAMPRFSGSITTSLDAKNRLTIPARFRDQLLCDAAGGNRVVVSRWVDPCLVIHPLTEWEQRCQEILRIGDTDAEKRRFRYVILGTAQDLEIDRQNRILLPQSLREAAGIKKEITLVGDIERILIWDSQRWAGISDLSNERLSEMYTQFYSEQPPSGGQ